MTRVNLIGEFFSMSGGGVHCRNTAQALFDLGVDVRIECNKPAQWERVVNDCELEALTKPFNHDCTTIHIGQPPTWPISLAKKTSKFFGFVIWEGDLIPNYWLKYIYDDRVDKVLVPSLETKQSIINTLRETDMVYNDSYIDKIVVIPHGYDPKKFYPEEKKHSEKLILCANKGFSKGINDRGGIQWMLKAYLEEFNIEDEIELRVKINSVYNHEGWNIEEEMKKLGIEKKESNPRVIFATNNVEDHSLRTFYNEADVFINTSMGDAFGIPIVEAMSCGLPVLTTKPFVGGAIAVDESNGWLINKGEKDYYSDEITYEDTKWFKPNIKEIKNKLRYVYDHQEEIKIKSERSIKDSKKYTWMESTKKLLELIKE